MGGKRATFAQWHNDTQRELPRGTSARSRGPWTSPRDTPARVPQCRTSTTFLCAPLFSSQQHVRDAVLKRGVFTRHTAVAAAAPTRTPSMKVETEAVRNTACQ